MFIMLAHLDTIAVQFDGQDHMSEFTVTWGKCC